jgi:isopentenyldiphosphate isomerase
MLSDEEEILDLVDEDDKVIGTITHTQAYDIIHTKQGYLRASNMFIINSRGELWIPRRQPHKKIAPNGLDYSMGEHVQSGETYLEAAVRGCQEELNLQLSPEELTFICKLAPEPGLPPYFTCDYLYYSDNEPNYSKEDFVTAEWIQPGELMNRLHNAQETAKASMPYSLKALLDYQAQHRSDQ